MKKRITYLCLIVGIIMLLAGCSAKESASAEKVISVGFTDVLDHLDNHQYSMNATAIATGPIHRCMFEYDKDMNICGAVVEEWDWVEDTKMEFTVRKGMKFHNGREVTAKDIKENIEQVLVPEFGYKNQVKLASIESVEVYDDLHGALILNGPDSGIMDALTWLAIIPMETYDKQATAPVGCGPFKFESYEIGQELVMVKNPDYYEADKIWADKIIMRFFGESSTMMSAFLAHEIDSIFQAQPEDLGTLRGTENVMVENNNIIGNNYLAINVERPPFDNKLLRQAIKYAIDKEQLLKLAYENEAVILSTGIMPSDTFYDNSFEYGRDLEKAKQLLTEAGYPDGLEIDIYTQAVTMNGAVADIISNNLADIGIKANVIKEEVGASVARGFGSHDYGLFFCGDVGSPNPLTVCQNYFGSGNIMNYNNDDVNALIEKGRSTYDQSQWKGIYHDLYAITEDDTPIVWLAATNCYAARWNNLNGVILRSNYYNSWEYATKE